MKNSNGLTATEVTKRQEKYGLNKLDEKKPTPLAILFLSQFVDILIGLLLVAAVAAYAIGDVIDACVIVLAVLLNVIMGFIQEYRSRKTMESLKNLIVKTAVVKRDGEIREINSEDLTIDDIVILEEGSKVPADLTLIEVNDLSCDESSLTGESEAIRKEVSDEVYRTPMSFQVTELGLSKTLECRQKSVKSPRLFRKRMRTLHLKPRWEILERH